MRESCTECVAILYPCPFNALQPAAADTHVTSGGAEDLERAKRRLSDFTFVLLLEDYERHGREALRTRFGWTEFKRAGTYHNSEASSELNVEVLAWMKSHNALDIELYAFAQQLYTMQQAELAGHHVAKGGSKHLNDLRGAARKMH